MDKFNPARQYGGETSLDSIEDDALGDEISELRELRQMRSFLLTENERLRRSRDGLTDEMKGLELTVAATRANMNFFETRERKSIQNEAQLAEKREELIQAATTMHLNIKSLQIEAEATVRLKDNLTDDLTDIERQKKTVTNRLKDVQSGLHEISDHQKRRLPHLRWYDKALRQIRSTFIEAQNKMEVSLLLRRK